MYFSLYLKPMINPKIFYFILWVADDWFYSKRKCLQLHIQFLQEFIVDEGMLQMSSIYILVH